MASGKMWTNICPDCGRHVEILNGDFEFSMELHKQSHKSLDQVNAFERGFNCSSEKLDNASKLKLNYCHDCKENFEIISNDLSLSFQLHAQRHKPDNADALSDHCSSSSSKSKESQEVAKEKEQPQSAVTSILDAVFHTMPIGLKAHQNFISEQGCSKAICNLCEITVEPISLISNHLKTKLHEDNTVTAIKSILSSELHDQMEFVSFYGSNLSCYLCRCKIDLCSENLHKTAVNIFVHNAGKGHMSKKTASKEGNQSNESHVILKSFALMNPLVNENQHLIEHKMYPHFKCKPCEKQITYSENQNEMVNNFTNHFNSQSHVKHLSAVSLLTKWSSLNICGKEKHNFVVAKQNIFCASCNSDVEANLDNLITHVRRNSALYGSMQEVLTLNSPYVKSADLFPSQDENMRKSEDNLNKHSERQLFLAQEDSKRMQSFLKERSKFLRIVQSLPVEFQKVIIQNAKGEVMCSVCNRIIPLSTFNLTTHLNGNSHKKKQNEVESSKKVVNSVQPTKSPDPRSKVTLVSYRLLENKKDYFVKYGENYICDLCGVIIQADVNFFQKKALSHVESQDHILKVQLKEEMIRLLPRHRDALVRELFDCIPMSFQKDIKFIKTPEEINFAFCEICCIKIPRHRQCLLEHLEGGYHESSVKRLAAVERQKLLEVKSELLKCKKKIKKGSPFQELLKCNEEIKANSKYLIKVKDDYLCKICKTIIKNSDEKNLLKGNIISHIAENKHKKNVEDEFNDLLDQIQLFSAVVKSNRSFLKKVNNNIVCTVCSCQMSLADSVEALRNSLEIHLSGSTHEKNVGVCTNPRNSPIVFNVT